MAESTSTPVLSPFPLDTTTQLMDVSAAQPSTSPDNQLCPPSSTMSEISLTFLLISGRRRTMSFASSTTIGRVKELVWNSWPTDWSDQRPPAPNYLRILYLGKMLQDEEVLEAICNLSSTGPGLSSSASSTSPTTPGVQLHSIIVHLSIRPVPPPGEIEDLKKKKRRIGSSTSGGADGDAERAGCCSFCVIC